MALAPLNAFVYQLIIARDYLEISIASILGNRVVLGGTRITRRYFEEEIVRRTRREKRNVSKKMRKEI